MLTKLTVLAVLLFLFDSPARAVTSGNDMVPKCKASLRMADSNFPASDAPDATFCMGFIEGVLEMDEIWSAVDKKSENVKTRHYCIPSGVTLEQEIRIFLN